MKTGQNVLIGAGDSGTTMIGGGVVIAAFVGSGVGAGVGSFVGGGVAMLTVRSATGRARSSDGRTWVWEGVVLSPPDEGWDSHETRISCLLAPDLALYDGIARPEDNYGEQTRIAPREPDGQWRSITTAGPVLAARYVAFDGTRFFWEHTLPDDSHELRAAQPSVAVESESTAGR